MNRLSALAARARVAMEIQLHRHGPWWLVLLMLAVALVGVWLAVIPRLEAGISAQRDTLARLQAQLAGAEPTPAPPIAVAHANYHAYCAALRDEDSLLEAIREILAVAGQHRLLLTRVEYVRSRDVDAHAEAVRMTVPVRGRYGDIRAWIETILAAQSSLAVNDLAFKREEISAAEVEARVRLTIWHHPRERVCRRPDGGDNAEEKQ